MFKLRLDHNEFASNALKKCKQHKNIIMVVLETRLVIAKIKKLNLPRFLSNSSRVSIFCAARVVADFSDRATRADNKIYGVLQILLHGNSYKNSLPDQAIHRFKERKFVFPVILN